LLTLLCDLFFIWKKGLPYNICSYSLFTVLLAKTVGLRPGSFRVVVGDAHLYKDHLDAARIQSMREPFPFPTLEIKHTADSVEDYNWEDLELRGYRHHPSLGKLHMSV
jgi:thymidylate synthase